MGDTRRGPGMLSGLAPWTLLVLMATAGMDRWILIRWRRSFSGRSRPMTKVVPFRGLTRVAGPIHVLSARLAGRGLQAVLAVAATTALASPTDVAPADASQTVPSAAVAARGGAGSTGYEGVVEAVRQTIVAAQVPGAVVALQVRAGDKVRAGQVLMRIDSRAADQTAAAGAAQARAARAAMEVATRELERQRQLFAQRFISQTALDQAEGRFKTAQAEASAQLANAGAAKTQSDFYIVKAPYAGVVANVSVVLGEMAMPGRALLTLYDPKALRVTAAIPQTAVSKLGGQLAPLAEIPGAAAGPLKPVDVQVLPTVDAASAPQPLKALSGAREQCSI